VLFERDDEVSFERFDDGGTDRLALVIECMIVGADAADM
jgi:hypothetical protein